MKKILNTFWVLILVASAGVTSAQIEPGVLGGLHLADNHIK